MTIQTDSEVDNTALAERVLRILRDSACSGAEREPYSTYDHRSVIHVIDETPCPVYPRVQLEVIASYRPWVERLCLYGNRKGASTADGGRNRYKPVYRCWYEGDAYALTEHQAVQLLATGRLPVRQRRRVEVVSPGQPADPFEGLGR